MAINIFRNNYPSAVDNHFISSLLDKDFCAVQKKKKKKKKKKKHFKIQHEFSDRCSKHGIYTLPGGVVGWGKSIVLLILAYSWARPAILAAGKGRGECFYFFCFFTFIHFPFSHVPRLHLLYCLLSLFSLSLGDDTTWPTRVDVSLNPNSVKSITCCQVTKHGPFTDLRANKNSVSVVRE